MRRREFIAGLGGVAAWPLAARAQQTAVPVIGLLSGATLESTREDVASFHQGLAETGYIENRNVTIEYRWAEGDNDRLPVLAADLVRRQVAVIVAFASTPAAFAAKAATQTIPIVFQVGPDPVRNGLVASLARPGGNLTGATTIDVELIAKTLSLIHELVPAASTIAVLVNPANPIQTKLK
jgi:putative tryptophan/tyrosine transport system substrate-binding protein